MQTSNNPTLTNSYLRILTKTALLNFKELSSSIKSGGRNGPKLSVLSLYVLLCLHESKPMLRHHLTKRLRINYYDAGHAIDQLLLNGLISVEEPKERTIQKMTVGRKRYQLTLSGTIFVSHLLNQLGGL